MSACLADTSASLAQSLLRSYSLYSSVSASSWVGSYSMTFSHQYVQISGFLTLVAAIFATSITLAARWSSGVRSTSASLSLISFSQSRRFS
jgi:hypothetical protein